ncbi:putative Ig domain-containing protein, partial [Pseudomonas citronellolis]|uniref:putative Ig domain-containing protein n=1 Tax=Pseudomonas citronellolis TaxID=53408 RepID=UPI0023E3F753
DNGATWTAASSTVGQSTWSLAGATLTASDTLLVKVADLAGNDGAVYSQSYAYDTSAPAISLGGLALSNDSNLAGDFITSQAVQTISGTLSSTLGAGDSLYGSLDGGATWTDLGGSLSGTALSWSGVTLAGSNTLVLKVVDVAGNATVLASQAYALDTSAPTTTFGNIALSNDSGASNTDLITNAAAQTISATLSAALDAGEKVYGSLDNGATWTDITGKVSGTSLSWDGATLVSGGALQLKVVDAAGNEGAITSQAYVLDTSPSTTTVTGAAFSNDRGNDFDLNVAAQTVNGTLSANLAAGESVLVSLDDGATWSTASATVGQSGWSLPGVTLSTGGTLLVKVVDVAGNDGALYSQAYSYSSQVPFIPLPPQTQLPPPVVIELPASIPLPPPPALGGGLSASLFDAPSRPIASAGGWGDAPRPSLAALDVDSLAQQRGGANGRGDLLGNDGVLTVNAPLADQNVQGSGERVSFSLPADAFYFAGSADDLRLNATLADGQPMPAWLKFDARLGRFEGTPPPGFHGTLRISVLARDDRGHVAVQTFTLVIGERISVSEHSQAPTGRPSLAEQLRTPRDSHAQRLAALANAVTQRR